MEAHSKVGMAARAKTIWVRVENISMRMAGIESVLVNCYYEKRPHAFDRLSEDIWRITNIALSKNEEM